ncbi:MAG: M28 family peptidase [Phycisphaerales bacterium]
MLAIAAAALSLALPQPEDELLREVSAERLKQTVDTLASFGTRHTLSATDDPKRGIGAARDWLLAEMKAAGGSLTAEAEAFDAPRSVRLPDGARIVNIVGRVKGSMPEAASRLYYVVGHYDSRNSEAMDATTDAPGANDDASGTAVVMELARVLADHPLESTVVFLCTAAEEQGLIGAKFHSDTVAADTSVRVMAVLNNDIVGDPWGARPRLPDAPERFQIRVFSHGLPRNPSAQEYADIKAWSSSNDSGGRQLARFVFDAAAAAKTAVRPVVIFRDDRFLRGGDHTPFAERGVPAIRFTAPHEDYSRQHVGVTTKDGKPYGDIPEFVDGAYMADVARVNLAALIALANAPSPPTNVRMLTAALTTDTELRWNPSPEPDVAGYEVVWRETTEWNWTHSFDAKRETAAVIPVSKDACFFGVRSYDKDGNRSPVQFAGAAKE